MFSLSRWIAGGCSLALALSFAIAGEPLAAQSATQDTAHKTNTMQMPTNMPMVKKTQKKKATSKTTRAKKPGAGKSTAKIAKKSVPPSSAAERQAGPTRVDSARHEMGGMNMQPAPAKTDATKAPGMAGMQMPSKPTDSARIGMTGLQHHSADDMMIGPVGVSMERMGSGTTWIPDAVSLPSRRRMLGDWMLMAHGFVFAQYDKQSGERGDDQFGSLNWGMLMATHDFAGGRFQARTMLSLDPLTVTNRGYPLLLQTGETYKGQPLHDRQHPHDFWMELGALYQREINKGLAWSIYAAPSGEPALGPVAFMHRPSAMDNPAAPLGHHWQDATHVTFGVLTGGIYSRKWQLESSVFNSRDPDENRWDFDPIRLDSYSGRLTVNPDAHWSIMGGYGYLKSHDALAPDESCTARPRPCFTELGWVLRDNGLALSSGVQISTTQRPDGRTHSWWRARRFSIGTTHFSAEASWWIRVPTISSSTTLSSHEMERCSPAFLPAGDSTSVRYSLAISGK